MSWLYENNSIPKDAVSIFTTRAAETVNKITSAI